MCLAYLLSAIANPMATAAGPGWVCIFFAALGVFAMCLMMLLKTHGPPIRQFSGF
jgi:hypothetical protein